MLERRPVRDEARGEPHSCFGDDLWDLSAAVFEAHASPVQLDWLAFPEQMRRSFKEYFWAIINIDTATLETNHTAWSIATIRNHHRYLRSFAHRLSLIHI